MGIIMGSYLSEPIREKISSDEANDKLKSGASSMQGWRVSQEDAHNCLLDFDTNTSLFAVYDGHGGHEVAIYCSQKLPQYIKDTDAYKNKDFEKALIDAFLGFDATIATPEIVEQLKKLVGVKENENDNESGSSDLEENVSNLYAEATMPLEQVIEKYTSNLKNPLVHSLQKDGEKPPVSPFLRARKDPPATNEACSSSSSNKDSKKEKDNAPSSSGSASESSTMVPESSAAPTSSEAETSNTEKNVSKENRKVHEGSGNSAQEAKTVEKEPVEVTSSKKSELDKGAGSDQPNQNGDVRNPVNEKSEGDVSSKSPQEGETTPQENGEITNKKGKGKATTKTKGVSRVNPVKRIRPVRNAKQLYSKMLEFESEESESEDEDDKTFQGPTEASSSDDDQNASKADNENSDASSEDAEEEELDEEEDLEDEEDIDEEEDDDDMDEANLEFARNMREEPGSDSGCTAVVALLNENQLFVANAGDSRCIVCRNGKAIEMSIDHKPEDEKEHDRVVKAGGHVTCDGRVNGGLNLSRAIGDHAYKQEKELSPREQMITALPDVRMLTINPVEDEFMVLACDGIWNFMSSQQVVDFVRPRIQQEPEKLSKICEEMFEHCLAPNTLGDGTGCDNMTAIIVQFKSNLCKRSASSDDLKESGQLKRAKTDEDSVSQTETTTA